jgi:hypothetical protein
MIPKLNVCCVALAAFSPELSSAHFTDPLSLTTVTCFRRGELDLGLCSVASDLTDGLIAVGTRARRRNTGRTFVARSRVAITAGFADAFAWNNPSALIRDKQKPLGVSSNESTL